MRRLVAAVAALLLAALPAAAQFQGPPSPYIDNALTGGAGGSGMTVNGSNATAGTTKDNLQLVRDLKKDFGATCNGTADDTAAFTAATAWFATSPTNQLVTLPAAVCATSTTVTIGNGRQQSTTLAAQATGTPSSVTVASCTGIVSGDAVLIVRDDATNYTGTAGTCVAGVLGISPAYSGGVAAIGKTVFTGKISSYNGGGFVGYGTGATTGEWPGGAAISSIKYIGAAAPTTTLSDAAALGDKQLTLTATTGIALGTPVGVTLNTGAVWWSWAAETPTSTVVKLGNALPAAINNGNAVTIANNPVVAVNGPIIGVRLENILLDGNSLAGVGADIRHSLLGSFGGPNRLMVRSYSAIGLYAHSSEFYTATAIGMGNNDFSLHVIGPSTATSIGCWLRGSKTGLAVPGVAFSRNRFAGDCTAGGNDTTAAAIRMEFADNNVWDEPYTSQKGGGSPALGAGLYRQPSINTSLFPGGNNWTKGAFIGGVVDGTDQGGTGTVGPDTFPAYGTGDGETIPAATSGLGYTEYGVVFGRLVNKDQFSGLALTKIGNQQFSIAVGQAADSTSHVMLRTLSACSVLLTASGAGGLDTGAVAASTWYAIFIIGPNIVGGTSCVATATTAAAVPTPTLPAGYSYYSYVGRAKTDGSSFIRSETVLPRGQFYIDAGDTYTPGASGFTPTAVRLLACGGGGGGASGGKQTSGLAISGGSGGSGGGCMDVTYSRESLPATLLVTVGAGGAIASQPAGTTNVAGTAGNGGNPTFFGAAASTAYAYGAKGCAGSGGQLAANSASGGSGGGVINTAISISSCTDGVTTTAGAGQIPGNGVAGAAGAIGVMGTGNGAGGSGGGGIAAGTATRGGDASGRFSCGGGGSGGGVTTVPGPNNGGLAAIMADSGVARPAGGTAGTPAGGNGTLGYSIFLPGASGGGGYGNNANPAGAGGAGVQCSGGGGGGSTLNNQTAGAGGKGGDGYAFVWELR